VNEKEMFIAITWRKSVKFEVDNHILLQALAWFSMRYLMLRKICNYLAMWGFS